MTAIETIEIERNVEVALDLNANYAVPFHPTDASLDSPPTNVHHPPLDDSSTISLAQSQFVSAVTSAIGILNNRYGYSKDNATNLILKEIGQGDVSPDNEEIFQVMLLTGLGVSDATKALTVSKALQKALVECSSSLSQAINYLTLQLKISRLLGMVESSETLELSSSVVKNGSELLATNEQTSLNNVEPKKSPDEKSPAMSKSYVPRIPTSISRMNQLPNNSHRNTKQIALTRAPLPSKTSRKRQLSGGDVAALASLKSSDMVAKADETTHNTDAEAVKKAIFAKEQSTGRDGPVLRSKSSAPTITRTIKLTSSQRDNDMTMQAQHPPLKRPRVDSV